MRALGRVILLAALGVVLLPAASASAGRLLVTGHDADLHCSFGSQCHFVRIATDYVRAGAPDPNKPVLVLDRAPFEGESLDFVVALQNAYAPGAPPPQVVMDPRSPEFQLEPLTTDRYSAILIASDETCGGCDLNTPTPTSETPDSDAINARSGDIGAFFNAGGGVYANSGASHGDGDPQTGPDTYYQFLPIPVGGAPVVGPFCLTEIGAGIGLEDPQGCPDPSRHRGSNDDINCCATHNSFTPPPAGTALSVAEIDVGFDQVPGTSDDVAETLVAEGVSRGGQIVPPDTTAPDTTPPDTPIVSGPPASSKDHTPTFTFSSTEPARFECSLDGGPFVGCSSPFTTPRLEPGQHTFTVRAIDAAGNADPTPTVYGFEVQPFTLADLPDPVLGQTVNVQEVRGSVRVGLPRSTASAARAGRVRASQKGISFVPLTEARQVPVGSFLDTRRGTVRLQSARNRSGARQSGNFLSSIFQVKQSSKRRAKGLTDLVLKGASFRRCRTGARAKGSDASAAVNRRIIRRLRATARGRFRTRGRYSSATVRGTRWDTIDRCDGTLTRVRRGRVAVRDFRRQRNILLTAGKSYLAKAPR